ncbi:MAG TPA: hypothetical protein V6D29_14280 [Leptolyngbyaceae cyanobacterium]
MLQSTGPGTPVPPISPGHSPKREKMRHLLLGSLDGIDRIIKILHVLNYAEPNDWSDPIPTGRPNEWMVILTKTILFE